jgi:hypothetical protein
MLPLCRSPCIHLLVLNIFFVFFAFLQLVSEMDTRGISSSRDQYNWGAYYKRTERSVLNMCAKGQSDGKTTKNKKVSSLRDFFVLCSATVRLKLNWCCYVIMKYFVNINRI